MSIFNKLFGSSEQESTSKIEWRKLTDLGQLNELTDLSFEKPVLIFKHSTRCSISRFALKQFDEKESDKNYIFEIPYGSHFRIQNGKVFKKIFERKPDGCHHLHGTAP